MATRTHTVYFSDDDLVPLRAAIEALEADWAERSPYISADVKQKVEGRFIVLKAAAELLAEEAD